MPFHWRIGGGTSNNGPTDDAGESIGKRAVEGGRWGMKDRTVKTRAICWHWIKNREAVIIINYYLRFERLYTKCMWMFLSYVMLFVRLFSLFFFCSSPLSIGNEHKTRQLYQNRSRESERECESSRSIVRLWAFVAFVVIEEVKTAWRLWYPYPSARCCRFSDNRIESRDEI